MELCHNNSKVIKTLEFLQIGAANLETSVELSQKTRNRSIMTQLYYHSWAYIRRIIFATMKTRAYLHLSLLCSQQLGHGNSLNVHQLMDNENVNYAQWDFTQLYNLVNKQPLTVTCKTLRASEDEMLRD